MQSHHDIKRHIFISYSRRDLVLAGRIVDALAERSLDTWIDWKSIPKGEDWEQEIYRGIEGADAFIFLISPYSVQSEMCNKEILHAIENNKRILPVLLHEVGSATYWEQTAGARINSLNWIFCREGRDDFLAAIEQIQITIRTDYDWVRFHTSLQVKALAWERSKKDGSRLLRGKELKEAEDKVFKISLKTEPLPTEMQRQFLQVSRKTYRKQRRAPYMVVLSVIGTVTLLGLWMTGVAYQLFPIQPGCPDLAELRILMNTDGLSPDARQVLEKAQEESPTKSIIHGCDSPRTLGTSDTDLMIVATDGDSSDLIWLEVRLPKVPAFELDFLPEVRTFGPERVSVEEAAILIRAASAYSLGDYKAVSLILEKMDNVSDGTRQTASEGGLILLAQANLFLNNLDESQKAYELALANAETGSELAGHLHMGAALSYWRPLLYDNFYAGKDKACKQAMDHYNRVGPWFDGEAFVNNVKVVYAYEFHCDQAAWTDLPEQEDALDPKANAIANFIRAKRCTVDSVLPGCDYLSDLTKAETHMLFARALLIRHYYQRVITDDACSTAGRYLASFQKDVINPQDVAELKALFRIKALNCD